MKQEVSTAKIFGYAVVIIICVFLLLIGGSTLPTIYWPITMLAAVIILIFNIANWKKESYNLDVMQLAVINISISMFHFTLYFFIFGIASGFTKASVSLGLPILISIVLTVIDVVILIRKNDIKKGMRGFSVSLGAYVYTGILLLLFSQFLFVTPQNNPKDMAVTDNNQIIKLSLNKLYKDGDIHAVVYPETSFGDAEQIKREILKTSTVYLNHGYYYLQTDLAYVKIEEAVFRELVNKLLEINQSPAKLEVPSSPQNGYYIDYDRQYTGTVRYSQQVWRFTHPANGPLVEISSPVYDKYSGLVILYVKTNSQYIYFIEYFNGEFEVLDYFEL